MLSGIKWCVFIPMLSVVMLNVIMLIVVGPRQTVAKTESAPNADLMQI